MSKVLIIKLGYSETLDNEVGLVSSLGDILRTTVILHLFKNDKVTWLVDEKAYPLLEGNEYIDRILVYNLDSVLQLQSERYDTVINLEKIPGICALSDSIKAWKRYGFRFDEEKGECQAYDGSKKVLLISRNLEFKRSNSESWSKALVEMVGGKWERQEYILGYKPKAKVEYDVGFNWTVGSKWENKGWPKDYWDKLEKLLRNMYSCTWQEGFDDIKRYIDWVNSCRLLVTADSLGVHIALALGKQVLVLYGPTSSVEVYLYGRGKGIFPEVDYDCIPCLRTRCTKPKCCMFFIYPERIAEEIKGMFPKR